MRVYISAPRAPDALPILRRVVEGLGHEVVGEDAGAAAPLGRARAAFEADFDALSAADLLLAEASEESHDVGWRTAWMLVKGRLVVLCARRGAALPAVLAGNPSPWQRLVPYESPEDLEARVRELLA